MFFAKLNKPLGKTPFQLIQTFSKKTGRKYFHTGTLDVLATGLILAVGTRYRFLEKPLKKLNKTYQFEIIQGFSTDTHDLLGLVQDIVKRDCPEIQLPQNYKFQVPPKVSYKNLNSKAKLSNFLAGKPLPELSTKKVKIYNLKCLGSYTVTKNELYKKINSDFKKVGGNFRQEKIIKRYKSTKAKIPNKLTIYRYEIKVSSGFYIRAFVRDIATLNNTCLTTYSINRTKIGFFKL